jgi:hypothetical protein
VFPWRVFTILFGIMGFSALLRTITAFAGKEQYMPRSGATVDPSQKWVMLLITLVFAGIAYFFWKLDQRSEY